MKLYGLTLVATAAAILVSCSQHTEPAIPQNREIEIKIEKILKGMTLEEKVGQMTQIAITAVADGLELTPAGDSIMRTYKVGSILNTPGDIAQSPEGYNELVKELNRIALETTGIPCLYGLDHIHGTSYVLGGTLFPQEIAIAASLMGQSLVPVFAQNDSNDKTTIDFKVMATSDLHSNLMNYDYFTGSTTNNSGLVKAATVIKEEKALANKSDKSEVDNVLLVDNGDTIEGTPLANLYAIKNPVKPEEASIA